MTEPLYSVGQHVAVCSSDLSVVIPSTTVCEHKFFRNFHAVNRPGLILSNVHTYRVKGCPLWIAESALRPINPDTEYLSEPESLEQPA